jgi:hypothetical protein
VIVEHETTVTVLMVKWKTFLLMSPEMILLHQKHRLRTQIQTVVLTHKLDSVSKLKLEVCHTSQNS